MKTIKDISVKDKRVILRVDYNVTLDAYGKIIDDVKIRATIPTIKYLIKNKVKEIIILSHMGRPIVQKNAKIEDVIKGNHGLTLEPIANDLAKKLRINLSKLKREYDNKFALPIYRLSEKIVMMENLRFDPREEENDSVFAKKLADLGDIYVDDAFGNAHRKHASMVAVTKFVPSYAGLLFEKEIKVFQKILKNPPKPFVLIIGGAKVSDKIKILKKLVKKADKILLGGVMANTFLVSRKIDMKASKYDKDSVSVASDIYSKDAGKFYLPTDLVWKGGMAVDIGKTTQDQYKWVIRKAKTVFWNGTMGLTSLGNFKYAMGTKAVIEAIAESGAEEKIVCGGDTIAEVDKMGMVDKMTHVSTGGGASLVYLAGEKLSAVEALENSK